MKTNLERIKNNYKRFERKRILDDFYTKSIKKGKKTVADRLDFVGILSILLIIIGMITYRIVDNFMLSIIITSLISSIVFVYIIEYRIRLREKKIAELKNMLKTKLKEDKIDLPDDNLDNYIVNQYLEEKNKVKGNMKFLTKEKIFKLYLLSILFLLISYFSSFPKYYKIMSIICFISGTIIGSYNFTEYLRLKDKKL